MDEKVSEVLLPMLENQRPENSPAGLRDAALGVDSTNNALIALLTQVIAENKNGRNPPNELKKGFMNATGKILAGSVATGLATTATVFVIKYSTKIIAFLQKFPGGREMQTNLEWITKSVAS